MKNKRQSKILEIIEKNDVETQEELITRLQDAGYDVTQATVSRDIRELKLTKILGGEGKYKYTLQKSTRDAYIPDYTSKISTSIISVDYAVNLVVVKTYPGMAQAIAAVIDSAHIKGVMGCVAGDDTIFLAIRDPDLTADAAHEIKKIAER